MAQQFANVDDKVAFYEHRFGELCRFIGTVLVIMPGPESPRKQRLGVVKEDGEVAYPLRCEATVINN